MLQTTDYSFGMTQLPNNDFNPAFDRTTYTTLNSMLSLGDESSNIGLEWTSDSGTDPSSWFDDVLNQDTGNQFTGEQTDPYTTPILPPSYQNEALVFDQSELAVRFNVPVTEVIISTTPSDAQTTTGNDLESTTSPNEGLDLVSGYFPTLPSDGIVSKMVDLVMLSNTDHSIQERRMTVEVQPAETLHPRYASDGKRHIENSRLNPMMIKLPNLGGIQSESHQIFLVRLALITHSENQSDPIWIHPNILEYHSTDVIIFKDGSVGVPLTDSDREAGRKKLPRLAIVKQTLGAYRSALKSFNLFRNNLHFEEEVNETKKVSVKQAKAMVKRYNLTASRISCQLLIKRNDTIYGTDIACETHVLEHNAASASQKRPASAMNEREENEQRLIKSKKHKKKSSI